ncbi:Glutamate receptor ionotropic N-methyl D-aspartate-associated protein 1a (glutamate binding) [Trichostrongylus colubriformis]|uniref:Glutamate receptor ionotropic N-methyl D-aspartate-associated protein 1a (Glutamate binding) n=1 Tax=Trichostrongylus colubriformis TaxID=6319 RepID=A0AAN8EYS8_TRICO
MPPSNKNMLFSEQSIRSRFVTKVFILVTIMFGIVSVMCAVPFISPAFMVWTQENTAFFFSSIVVYFVVALVLLCCSSVRRSYPLNLIMLGIFTLATGYMVMATTSTYNVQSVLLALCMTTCSSAAIIVFAMFVKKDLTTMIGIAYIMGTTLMFFGITSIIACFAFNVTFLYTVYAALGALLSMLYLAIDIQLIMGGRKFELSPEEYIFAAMQIFLDILNIFLFFLQIFGKK